MFTKRLPRVAALAVTSALSMVVTSDAHAEPAAEWGGFGQAFVGGMLSNYGNFENEMAQPRVLGNDFSMSPVGLQFGGGGWMMLAGTVLVGGRGLGFVVDASDTQGARVSFAGGGGGLVIGYAALNRDSYLLYPFFGFGGYGFSMEMTNVLGGQDIAFGSERVAPDATDAFSAGFFSFEFGVGFQRLLFFDDGGFTVGAEGGFTIPVAPGGWNDADGRDISGLEELGISGGYLRLTLGGGGFLFGDDPSVNQHEVAVDRAPRR